MDLRELSHNLLNLGSKAAEKAGFDSAADPITFYAESARRAVSYIVETSHEFVEHYNLTEDQISELCRTVIEIVIEISVSTVLTRKDGR